MALSFANDAPIAGVAGERGGALQLRTRLAETSELGQEVAADARQQVIAVAVTATDHTIWSARAQAGTAGSVGCPELGVQRIFEFQFNRQVESMRRIASGRRPRKP
jgi:hypothetical protein